MNSLRRLRPLLLVSILFPGFVAPASALPIRVRPRMRPSLVGKTGASSTPWYGVRSARVSRRPGSFDGGHSMALEGRAQSAVHREATSQGLKVGEPRYDPQYNQRDGTLGRYTQEGFEYAPHPVRSTTGLRQGTISTVVRRDGTTITRTDLVDYRPAAAFGTATLGAGAAGSGYLLLRGVQGERGDEHGKGKGYRSAPPSGPYGLDQ